MPRSCPEEWSPIRLSDWPQDDRSAWLQAIREPDPLDLIPAPAAHLRPSTRRQYEVGYGVWLKWLLTNGCLDEDDTPGERATEERLRSYHQAMLDYGYAGYSIADRLVALAQVLKCIEPDGDFGWISLAARRIHQAARPVKDIRAGLRPSDELFQLGLELMDEAREGRFRAPLDRALLYRDGLLIALLAKRPVRVGNLAATVIGQHLRQVEGGWRLAYEGHEVKSHKPYACGWPEDLNDALQYYLDTVRPLLLRNAPQPPPAELWLSTVAGRRMRPGDILVRVRYWTTERFGRQMTPHHFRHAAATTVAIASPQDAGDITAILGHSSIRTSAEHYNLATSMEAAERCQDNVNRRRRYLGVRKAKPLKKLSLLALLGDEGNEPDAGD